MSQRSLRLSLPYFIAISIDAIGFTIVGPVLVPFVNQIVNNSGLSQHLLYGLILSIYSLSFMLGAPILGAISDLLGRRKVLIIASFGVLIGYLCYAISLNLSSLVFLILGRIMTGFCAASQCIAQAAMIDISEKDKRANNIGLIASAMSAGLVVGPLASLALSSPELSLNAFKIPFYCIMSALILNVIYLIFFLKESHETKSLDYKTKMIRHQCQQFFTQFTDSKMMRLFVIFFLFELGWSLYYQSLPIELPFNLKLEPHNLALLLSFLGISLTAALLILVRISSRYFKSTQASTYALPIGAIALMAQFFLNNLFFHYLLGIVITGCVALSYTSLITQLSLNTDSKNQGLLMGSSDALLALAFTITGLLAGYLSYASAGLPLFIAGAFWLIAFFVHGRKS